MEYCTASLKQYFSLKKKFTENEIRKILKEICQGLAFIHKHKCAHLGLKPQNILKSKNGRYRIADLGLSKL